MIIDSKLSDIRDDIYIIANIEPGTYYTFKIWKLPDGQQGKEEKEGKKNPTEVLIFGSSDPKRYLRLFLCIILFVTVVGRFCDHKCAGP